MAYAISSCFKNRAHHLAERWAWSPPRSTCQRAVSRRPEPLPRSAVLTTPFTRTPRVSWRSALLLLASPTDTWRPDRGRALPTPCSAPPWPCRHRVPRSRRQRLRWYHAWTPLAACALVYGLLRHLLDVALRCLWAGTNRRRAMPRFVVCCCGRANGYRGHALRFPMARQVSTER
jgi:hypothetical protein